MSDSNQPLRSGTRRKRNLSLRKKLCFSLFVTIGFFAILEASLAALGVSRETDSVDPFVGFVDQIPLMQVRVNASNEAIVSTAANKLVWFNWQSFPKQKPAHTKRIFCLGGSTTYGRPYRDLTSYSGWLREFFAVDPPADGSHDVAGGAPRWEVINAGGVSYASYRVAAVMEELAQYDPDLFIVYTAHNEFLERRTYADMFDTPPLRLRIDMALRSSRTWSVVQQFVNRVRQPPSANPKEMLAAEVDEMLNSSIGPTQYHRDDTWRANVLHHYETNLRRMVTIARSAGAEIMFITPASNEKDCSPFKSEHRQGIAEEEINRFDSSIELANNRIASGDLEGALENFQSAVAIDDRHSSLHYQMGRLLLRMGRQAEARQSLSQAIDEDVCPLRAVTEMSETVRRVARQENVPLVDFEAKLRAKCLAEQKHDSFGGEYFLDHVHPTIDVHRQLALWIIEAMKQLAVTHPRNLTDAEIDRVEQRIRGKIDGHELGVAFRNLAKVLHWAGKFEEAAPRARDALQLIEDDPESRFVLADCLTIMGRTSEAFDEYEKLFETGDYQQAYLPYGELLAQYGRLSDAKYYLTLAAVFEDKSHHRARALCYLGYAHVQSQEFKFSMQSLGEADMLCPDDPYTLLLLAEASVGIGKTDAAIGLYQRVAALDRTDGEAHNRLGLLYLKTNRFDEAISHFESAIAADPNNSEAGKNIAIAQAMKGR